jgi:hypothetical protein
MTVRSRTLRPRSLGHARRTRAVKRHSAGLTPVRAAALLTMLATGLGIYGAGASGAFAFRPERLAVSGARFTAKDAIGSALAIAPGSNLFMLATSPLQRRLEQLPTVLRAEVAVGLPDSVRVELTERRPILAWAIGDRRLLVDGAGRAFAQLDGTSGDPAVAAAVKGLPVVLDERAAAPGLGIGASVDSIEFDVATRLGALRPADVGSAATALIVAVTDQDGFVVRSVPDGWTAVFGFYSPTLRTPDLVPGQVRLLASLLVGREAKIGRIVLANATDGTYVPRETPKGSLAPSPTATP